MPEIYNNSIFVWNILRSSYTYFPFLLNSRNEKNFQMFQLVAYNILYVYLVKYWPNMEDDASERS